MVEFLGVVKYGKDGASCLGSVGSMFGCGDHVVFVAVDTSMTVDGECVAEPDRGQVGGAVLGLRVGPVDDERVLTRPWCHRALSAS